ncbi:MAG: M56 family metallopeptidase, partial [Verrucomicrobiota bacterium]
SQLEAVIAHELAHIRRYDHLVHVLQLLAEALLFFNPFLRWISAQVRREREACCDAMAVEVTGQRLTYIRTLVDAAEQTQAGAWSAMPAFPGGEESGSVMDRVRRLLKPSAAPEMRLGIPALLTLMVLSLGAIFALQLAANVTLRALTPTERIAAVEEVHAEYPQPALQESFDSSRTSSAGEVTLSGRVTLPDGSVPLGAGLTIRSERGNSISSSSYPVGTDGRFERTIRASMIHLLFQQDGYAPIYRELGQVTSGRMNLDFVFEKGKDARLKFLDEAGQPLRGVEVFYYLALPTNGRRMKATSNAEGLALIRSAAGFPLDWSTSIPGYEEGIWKDETLEPESVRELTLAVANPLRLAIRDAETGQPISGVQVRMGQRRSQGSNHSSGESSEPLALSGDDGVVEVDELRSDSIYYLLLSAEAYLGKTLGPCGSGDSLEVTLLPAEAKTVKISGLLDRSLDEEGRLQVRLGQTVHYGENHSVGMRSDRVTYAPHEGVVAFDYLPKWEGELEIVFGEVRHSFPWREWNVSERIELELAPDVHPIAGNASNAPLMRPVALHIRTPTGEPQAQGRLYVQYTKNGIRPGQSRSSDGKLVDVTDGWARFEVPVPNDLDVSPEGLKGYWFQEPIHMKVPAEHLSEPVVFELEALRAGAIAGDVKEANGDPAEGILVTAFEAKGSPSVVNGNFVNLRVKSSSSRYDAVNEFLASPLPLGGHYVVVARRGFTHVTSIAIPLTAEEPVKRIQLEMPEGIEVNGRILDAKGRGVRFAETRFRFTPRLGHGFGMAGPVTGVDGKFSLKGVNSQAEGTHYLEIDVPGHLPKRYALTGSRDEQLIRLERGQSIRGVVVEASTGKVIPGAEVYATRAKYVEDAYPSWFDTADADEQGRFEFTNLPPGEFKVLTRSGTFPSKVAPVVEAGQPEEVVLEVELYEWSKLLPVPPGSGR